MPKNLLSLTNPPAVWDSFLEPAGERQTYFLTAMDYCLARWVLAAAWTTNKPTQLAAVEMFAESVAQQIIIQRIEPFTIGTLRRGVA